jgi:replicative DNA helicase
MIQFKKSPCLTEAERQVIGTILTYPDILNDIIAILTPEMFCDLKLAAAYKHIIEINKKFGAADILTVNSELKKTTNEDETVFLTELTEPIITDQLIVIHATLIKEHWVKRSLLKLIIEVTDSIENDDMMDNLAKLETGLLKLSGMIYTREPKLLGLILNDVIDTIDKINKGEIKLFGVPSGFTALDRITSGFNPGELTIIAGRPSIGKTAIALQIAKNAAELGFPVGIFSCEMSQTAQAMRFLSGVSGFSNTQLRQRGRCDVGQLIESSSGLQKLGIYIDDTSAISLLELRAKTRKLILRYGIKMIFVDYLQLMTPGKQQNRVQEVSELSAGLKSIAVDLNIPVISLSQLNRKSEERADRKPLIFDMRDSGSIEQDADLVLILSRPQIDGKNSDFPNGNIVMDVAKHRNGATGEITLKHNESMTIITYED